MSDHPASRSLNRLRKMHQQATPPKTLLLPCLRYGISLSTTALLLPGITYMHACTPHSRIGTYSVSQRHMYLYTFRTILQAWDAVVYKHTPQNAVSNGILRAKLQLPEHVGVVTPGGGFAWCDLSNWIVLRWLTFWLVESVVCWTRYMFTRCRST
jgi:hypothetical protein